MAAMLALRCPRSDARKASDGEFPDIHHHLFRWLLPMRFPPGSGFSQADLRVVALR
jgi:hypothetical protein